MWNGKMARKKRWPMTTATWTVIARHGHKNHTCSHTHTISNHFNDKPPTTLTHTHSTRTNTNQIKFQFNKRTNFNISRFEFKWITEQIWIVVICIHFVQFFCVCCCCVFRSTNLAFFFFFFFCCFVLFNLNGGHIFNRMKRATMSLRNNRIAASCTDLSTLSSDNVDTKCKAKNNHPHQQQQQQQSVVIRTPCTHFSQCWCCKS